MSRSFKKVPVIKDKGCSSYNKSFRRVNKILIKEGKEPKLMKELINPYDVSDYSIGIYEKLKKESFEKLKKQNSILYPKSKTSMFFYKYFTIEDIRRLRRK